MDTQEDTGKNQEVQEVPSPKGLGGDEDGGQAFPRAGFIGPSYGEQSVEGMSLRDYFAAKALATLISTGNKGEVLGEEYAAAMAYEYADAMLQARRPQ